MAQEQQSVAEVLERTRSYLQENFLYMRPDVELKDDDALLQKGVVDSMGVIEVLEFLKEEFGVVIEDEEITEENLGSLSAIAEFVQGKQLLGKSTR